MTLSILIAVTLLSWEQSQPRFAQLRQPPEESLPKLADVINPDVDAAGWNRRREQIRADWQSIIGPFPERTPLATELITTEELPDHTRIHLRYQSDPVWKNEAYLLLPKAANGQRPSGKLPAMVVLHPTSKTHMADPVGLSNREAVHNALHLVRKGYVCIAPRNFLWSFDGKTYQQATETVLQQSPWKTGMAKMTWDAIRAVDVLAERPEVDPLRIGCLGHSLGGKEALYLAAFDERIRAAVSCEGGIGIPFSNWDADWYLGKQVKTPSFHRDHDELLALVAPRAFLLIGGESADGAKSWPYIAANLPLWRIFHAEEKLGVLRHPQGHDFPGPGANRDLVYQWLDAWLKDPK